MPERISVLLVDDHNLVRQGFRRILEDEKDMHVVGEAVWLRFAVIEPILGLKTVGSA